MNKESQYVTQRVELGVIVKNILNQQSLKWFIENGTLLGAFRTGISVPGDDDFDIAVLYDTNKDSLEYQQQKLLKFIQTKLPDQYLIRSVSTYARKLEVYLPSAGYYHLKAPRYNNAIFHNVTVDLQAYVDSGDGYFIRQYPTNMRCTPKHLILPLKTTQFHNESFNAPNKIKLWLKAAYGYIGENAVYNERTQLYEEEVSLTKPCTKHT